MYTKQFRRTIVLRHDHLKLVKLIAARTSTTTASLILLYQYSISRGKRNNENNQKRCVYTRQTLH